MMKVIYGLSWMMCCILSEASNTAQLIFIISFSRPFFGAAFCITMPAEADLIKVTIEREYSFHFYHSLQIYVQASKKRSQKTLDNMPRLNYFSFRHLFCLRENIFEVNKFC